MTKHFLIFSIITLLFIEVFAQHPHGQHPGHGQQPQMPAISGLVQNEFGEPLPYASVAIFDSQSNKSVTGVATDTQGKFRIGVKQGNYYLKVSFLSYEEKTIKNVQVGRAGAKLGVIVLQAGALALDEVEVAAEKSEMKLELDKRVFNVGKDLSNSGNNASEILDNVPSVTVDIDGNVSLRGSENVRILIDGKPSGLVGISSNDALRQLQGNMIESIEVITNPSARYDAEGEAGIINIILKKGKREGMNGSVEITTGYPDNYRASFSMNVRKKKINFFTSYGASYRQNPGSGHSLVNYNDPDTAYMYESTRTHTRGGLSHNLRLGTDYFINDHNTLTVSGFYRFSDRQNEAELIYEDFDIDTKKVINTNTRTEDEDETRKNIEANINYRKTFEQKGRVWTTDFKWMRSDDKENSDLLEQNNFGIVSTERASNTEDEHNILFQSDYVHPFGKDSKFEAGVKSNFKTLDNDYLVEEYTNNAWSPLQNFDNHFVYSEKIHAAYLIAASKIKKFSYQGGLRMEYSDITTELTKTNEKNHRTYADLFPSAHLSYALDSTNSVQLSYSRRLRRPGFWHLLPFFTISDSRTIFSGNPNLNPEYSNSFELGHLKDWKKGSLLSSVYYRHRTGKFERIMVFDEDDVIRFLPINMAVQDAYGLEFNLNYELTKWWRVNGNFNFYRAITDGEYRGKTLHSDTYSWSSRASSKMSLGKKVDFQASLMYRSPRTTTQGKRQAMYYLTTGLSMDVLKKRGTLTFSVKDLLNSMKRRITTDTEYFSSVNEFQWHSRQFLLTFSYRINQKKKRGRGTHPGGMDGDMEMF